MQEITSFQNSKVKLANKLISKRHREREGLFLIDYGRDLERAIGQGYEAVTVFYCSALASDGDKELLSALDESMIYVVDTELMSKVSYRQNPGGLVAIMAQKPRLAIADLYGRHTGHLLALVDLRKPGNIGALLRTADAAGLDTVCLIDSALDLYNPNIIRASTGAVFLDNVYQIHREEAFAYFTEARMTVVGAHLDGTESLYTLDFTRGRTAIVLGTEDSGLDAIWVDRCDSLVKIPMVGTLSDSLNVSVSGAVFMYEALRQHQQASN
ncbi:MAG: TrmH family RNA methyltransferase [Anaerolineae bacterium]